MPNELSKELCYPPTRHTCIGQLATSVGTMVAMSSLPAFAADKAVGKASALRYKPDIEAPFPIPQSKRNLHTVIATPYLQVSEKSLQLEVAPFDRQGNLLFVDISGGTVFKLTKD